MASPKDVDYATEANHSFYTAMAKGDYETVETYLPIYVELSDIKPKSWRQKEVYRKRRVSGRDDVLTALKTRATGLLAKRWSLFEEVERRNHYGEQEKEKTIKKIKDRAARARGHLQTCRAAVQELELAVADMGPTPLSLLEAISPEALEKAENEASMAMLEVAARGKDVAVAKPKGGDSKKG